MTANETAFEMAAANIRFGFGVTREVGAELANLGKQRVLVFTDPNLRALSPVTAVIESLEENKIQFSVFDRVRVEPTDESFRQAVSAAQAADFDAFVAVGGGSTIDTAKAANLYTCYPADFLDYVNAPIGKGKPVPGPLKTLIAIPTTAGTGSETTGVAVFDFVERHVKTGIAHRRLKPTLGLVDPENTRTLPPAVAASAGLDVFSHAIESYTAVPFQQRPRPERPDLRPAYQGSNPVSDMWSLEALRLVAAYLKRAVADPGDNEARASMLLASSYAGMGFGNAGVHLPHGMSYPVAGLIRNYRPQGYSVDHNMAPHGISVIVDAPAAYRCHVAGCSRASSEGSRNPRRQDQRRQAERCRQDSRGQGYRADARSARAQRIARTRLSTRRCSKAGGRSASATANHQALAPPGRRRRLRPALRRIHDDLVAAFARVA